MTEPHAPSTLRQTLQRLLNAAKRYEHANPEDDEFDAAVKEARNVLKRISRAHVENAALRDALGWQRLADEFCDFNTAADRVVMHNFAGWLAARVAHAEPGEGAAPLADLAARMVRDAAKLDPEAQRVLSANLWNLYMSERAAPREADAAGPSPDKDLDSQEFYELLQAYRHAPLYPQADVVAAFEAIKAWVRASRPVSDTPHV